MSLVHALVRGLDDLLFPPCCLACGGSSSIDPVGEALCASCLSAIANDPQESCPRCCASVGPHVDTAEGCPKCRNESFAFEEAFRFGAYDGVLRTVVLTMKHRAGEALAEAMGRVWATRRRERFQACRADILIPIPLHWRRFWQRGYNQAEALARGIGAVLECPVVTRGMKRDRFTPIQPSQTPAERRENVKNAFFVTKAKVMTGKRILLIDDVMTTGATAHEAAKALRSAGAAQVSLAVLAHR